MNQVLDGEGVGWLKLTRIRKLMEDENYRNLVVSRLNKTLDQKIGPDEHIDDVVRFVFIPYFVIVESKLKNFLFSVFPGQCGKV